MKCHKCNKEITIDDDYSLEYRNIEIYRAGLYDWKKSEEINEPLILRCLSCTKSRIK